MAYALTGLNTTDLKTLETALRAMGGNRTAHHLLKRVEDCRVEQLVREDLDRMDLLSGPTLCVLRDALTNNLAGQSSNPVERQIHMGIIAKLEARKVKDN